MARKPKILTRLRVDEISLVDRGAGEGVSVLYSKRNRGNARRYADVFRQVDFSKIHEPPVDVDIDSIGDGDGKLPGKMEEFITALQVANPSLSRADAAAYLLHGVHGRATARHMSETFKTKEQPMDRATELRSIAKDFGITKLAKMIADEGNAHGISEHELTDLGFVEAQKNMQAGERPNSAFSRWYSEPSQLDFRKALQVSKSVAAPLMDMKPTQTSDAFSTVTADDSAAAYAQLVDMAEAMRAKSPDLTIAQCFARVFTDSANAELAAKAHRRPVAGDSGYAYPTA
jgi:hypothetical protein